MFVLSVTPEHQRSKVIRELEGDLEVTRYRDISDCPQHGWFNCTYAVHTWNNQMTGKYKNTQCEREKAASLSHPCEKNIHVQRKLPKNQTFTSILNDEVWKWISNNLIQACVLKCLYNKNIYIKPDNHKSILWSHVSGKEILLQISLMLRKCSYWDYKKIKFYFVIKRYLYMYANILVSILHMQITYILKLFRLLFHDDIITQTLDMFTFKIYKSLSHKIHKHLYIHMK